MLKSIKIKDIISSNNSFLDESKYKFKVSREIPYVNPQTKNELVISENGEFLLDEFTQEKIAIIQYGIPRFVSPSENYAETFGWQWKKWAHNLSEERGSSVKHRELILERTKFENYNLENKTILECGMGGGDDTEVLISLPFKEIHSFDLSTAVERAANYLNSSKLFISQASIYSIPYPDGSFDFVYCHRVLQHTPDPVKSLRCMCKKVKPNGILFIHSYKRSNEYMKEWRYKYRWLTTRIPKKIVYFYVQYFGTFMDFLISLISKSGSIGKKIAYRYIPFYKISLLGEYSNLSRKEAIELEKLITFDALTPKYDNPMATDVLVRILKEEGFAIEHINDAVISPVYATARKVN